jgi:hypothetical protein
MVMRPADETPGERAARSPGFILAPALVAIVAVWIAAFSAPHAVHRLAAAAAVTGLITAIVVVGIYLGRRNFQRGVQG